MRRWETNAQKTKENVEIPPNYLSTHSTSDSTIRLHTLHISTTLPNYLCKRPCTSCHNDRNHGTCQGIIQTRIVIKIRSAVMLLCWRPIYCRIQISRRWSKLSSDRHTFFFTKYPRWRWFRLCWIVRMPRGNCRGRIRRVLCSPWVGMNCADVCWVMMMMMMVMRRRRR